VGKTRTPSVPDDARNDRVVPPDADQDLPVRLQCDRTGELVCAGEGVDYDPAVAVEGRIEISWTRERRRSRAQRQREHGREHREPAHLRPPGCSGDDAPAGRPGATAEGPPCRSLAQLNV
jgi:hypothetical protein